MFSPALFACFLFACASTPPPGGLDKEEKSKVENGYEIAKELRRNTVKVTTDKDNGFGFIVGESDGLLFVVTANHVVRGKNDFPGKAPSVESIKVEFFENQGARLPVTLLETSIYDIAILQVERPPNVSWRKKALSGKEPGEEDKVWFIGRKGEWYLPTIPGAINRVESERRITVDNVSVQEGTSGAPLITRYGIVGMVTLDGKDLVSYALPINVIEEAVKSWQRPWDLVEFDDREQVIQKAGLKPLPDDEGSNTLLWTLIGVLGAVALGGGSGDDGDDETGSVTVTAPAP